MPIIDPSLVPDIPTSDLFSRLLDEDLSIRWLTINDPNFYQALNRPISDVELRQLIIAKALGQALSDTAARQQYPFLIQPEVDGNTEQVNVPPQIITDLLVSIPSDHRDFRLVRIDRISGDGTDGVIRFIFGATDGDNNDVAIAFADYDIDNNKDIQIKNLQAANAVDVPSFTIASNLDQFFGRIIFSTRETDAISSFLVQIANSGSGQYNIIDTDAADDRVKAISFGTGLLTSTVWNSGGFGSGGAGATEKTVTSNQSLTVGHVVRYDTTLGWVKAQANSDENAEAAGVVSEVLGSNRYKVKSHGFIDLSNRPGTTEAPSIIPGVVYFLSADTPGGLTDDPPSDPSDVRKPILVGADTTDTASQEGVIVNYLGFRNNIQESSDNALSYQESVSSSKEADTDDYAVDPLNDQQHVVPYTSDGNSIDTTLIKGQVLGRFAGDSFGDPDNSVEEEFFNVTYQYDVENNEIDIQISAFINQSTNNYENIGGGIAVPSVASSTPLLVLTVTGTDIIEVYGYDDGSRLILNIEVDQATSANWTWTGNYLSEKFAPTFFMIQQEFTTKTSDNTLSLQKNVANRLVRDFSFDPLTDQQHVVSYGDEEISTTLMRGKFHGRTLYDTTSGGFTNDEDSFSMDYTYDVETKTIDVRLSSFLDVESNNSSAEFSATVPSSASGTPIGSGGNPAINVYAYDDGEELVINVENTNSAGGNTGSIDGYFSTDLYAPTLFLLEANEPLDGKTFVPLDRDNKEALSTGGFPASGTIDLESATGVAIPEGATHVLLRGRVDANSNPGGNGNLFFRIAQNNVTLNNDDAVAELSMTDGDDGTDTGAIVVKLDDSPPEIQWDAIKTGSLSIAGISYRIYVEGYYIDESVASAKNGLDASLFENNPIYPHVLTSDGKMTYSTAVGSITLSNAIEFVWRGGIKYSTSNFDRTFTTVANKTYHLRWQWNDNDPQMVLKDLADTSYNTGSFDETNTVFDSTFDDMLIARIVTDGSNNLSVTQLVNLNDLKDRLEGSADTNIVRNDLNDATGEGTITYNWARRPKNMSYYPRLTGSNTNTGELRDHGLSDIKLNRYEYEYLYFSDFHDMNLTRLIFNFSA